MAGKMLYQSSNMVMLSAHELWNSDWFDRDIEESLQMESWTEILSNHKPEREITCHELHSHTKPTQR